MNPIAKSQNSPTMLKFINLSDPFILCLLTKNKQNFVPPGTPKTAFVLHHQLKCWLIVTIVLKLNKVIGSTAKVNFYIIFYITLAFCGLLNVPLAPT